MKSAVLGKDLLGLERLSPDQIRLVLDTAEPFKEVSERLIKKVPALRGKTIVNLFRSEGPARARASLAGSDPPRPRYRRAVQGGVGAPHQEGARPAGQDDRQPLQIGRTCSGSSVSRRIRSASSSIPPSRSRRCRSASSRRCPPCGARRSSTSSDRKDLLGLERLSPDQIRLVLDTAEPFKEVSERLIKKVPALRGKTIVNLFRSQGPARARASLAGSDPPRPRYRRAVQGGVGAPHQEGARPAGQDDRQPLQIGRTCSGSSVSRRIRSASSSIPPSRSRRCRSASSRRCPPCGARRSSTSSDRKDLLGLERLSPDQIRLVLDTAEPFKEVSERLIKKVPALRGKTIVNLFRSQGPARARASLAGSDPPRPRYRRAVQGGVGAPHQEGARPAGQDDRQPLQIGRTCSGSSVSRRIRSASSSIPPSRSRRCRSASSRRCPPCGARRSSTSSDRKDLLGLERLSPDQIRLVLDTAEPFKEVSERLIKKVPALRGKTIVNLF